MCQWSESRVQAGLGSVWVRAVWTVIQAEPERLVFTWSQKPQASWQWCPGLRPRTPCPLCSYGSLHPHHCLHLLVCVRESEWPAERMPWAAWSQGGQCLAGVLCQRQVSSTSWPGVEREGEWERRICSVQPARPESQETPDSQGVTRSPGATQSLVCRGLKGQGQATTA